MNKEELKKEAIAKYKTGSYPQLHPDHYAFIHGYLAGAEPREEKITELETENEQIKNSDTLCKLIGEQKRKIAELEAEKDKAWWEGFDTCKAKVGEANVRLNDELEQLKKENAELKELLKNIIRVTWGEGWNYSLDWKVKAEQFLKENE